MRIGRTSICDTTRPASRKTGFVFLDAVIALAITVALLITLTIVIGQQRKAVVRMDDLKAAHERAETELLNLQGDQKSTAAPSPEVTIARTADPGPAPGYIWVKATAVVGHSTAEVYGVVKADHLSSASSSSSSTGGTK